MDKKKVQPQVTQREFLTKWIFQGLSIWIFAPPASAILVAPIIILGTLSTGIPPVSLNMLTILPLGLAMSWLIGELYGELQRELIATNLNLNIAQWKQRSIIGGLFATILIVLTIHIPHALQLIEWNSLTLAYLIMPLFMLGVSLSQWSILKNYRSSAWLWVLANFTGALVFNIFFIPNLALAFNANSVIMLMTLLIAPILQALITGYAMYYIVKYTPETTPIVPDTTRVPV